MRRPRLTRHDRGRTALSPLLARAHGLLTSGPALTVAIGVTAFAVATTGTVTVVADRADTPAAAAVPAPMTQGLTAETRPAVPPPAAAVPAEDLARPAPAAEPVAPLAARLRPDVLVTAPAPLETPAVQALAGSAPAGAELVRIGTLTLDGAPLTVIGVDPSTFRAFAPEGTAESDPVWQSVANGEIAVSHAAAQARGFVLGATLTAVGPTGATLPLRFGALASTGLPNADLIVSNGVADALGLAAGSVILLSAGATDPAKVAGAATAAAKGVPDARVDLLTPPAANPTAFLTGSKAAQAFGAFSYRYFPDGTIAPDDAWVRANIRTETLPLLGRMTCHRLMLPQLRGALQEISDAGLGSSLSTYDGCYVPRFINRDPDRPISLHTWGIAVDFDAATNYRGIRGTMDPRVVTIFKKWGFRWGGDWSYTDPMHFELGALLQP